MDKVDPMDRKMVPQVDLRADKVDKMGLRVDLPVGRSRSQIEYKQVLKQILLSVHPFNSASSRSLIRFSGHIQYGNQGH